MRRRPLARRRVRRANNRSRRFGCGLILVGLIMLLIAIWYLRRR